jgi:hypothetical protein
MTTLVESSRYTSKLWISAVAGFGILMLVAVSVPNLLRSREAANVAIRYAPQKQAFGNSTSQAKAPPSAATYFSGAEATTDSLQADRKIVRTSSLEMTVASPVEAAEKIRKFAESLGGYVESAQLSSQMAPSATITVRVPAARLEDARAELRRLALKIDSERTDAQDVTKLYVDMEATLHNLHAEEAQYLQIMKSAAKVQDMLDVSEHLSQVRGQIEQQQAEFAGLSKQVETVAIAISLRAQANADVLGFNWRPLYQFELAAHQALDGLADYASTMTAVILYLPVLLLWLTTGLLGGVAGWRTLRWIGRVFFAWPGTPASAQSNLS